MDGGLAVGADNSIDIRWCLQIGIIAIPPETA